jgi:hypothetical protein
MSDHHPQPDIVVTITYVIPVAVRRAHVPLIVVERAAAQNAVVVDQPPQQRLAPWTADSIVLALYHWLRDRPSKIARPRFAKHPVA